MQNGRSFPDCFRPLSRAVDPVALTCDTFSMGCFIWSALAAPGATCRASTGPGPRCITIFGNFVAMERGNGCIHTCGSWPASGQDEIPPPAQRLSDSQSIRTHQGGPRGFDGGKKIFGRKRHVLVDTLGLLLKVVVHPASLHDRQGAKLVLGALGTAFPRLQLIWADQGYAGALRQWTKEHIGVTLEVVYPWWRHLKRYFPDFLDDFGYQPGFNVIPRRWVVERTISWLGRARRLSKDYERLPVSSEALIYLTSIRLLLVRLARNAVGRHLT